MYVCMYVCETMYIHIYVYECMYICIYLFGMFVCMYNYAYYIRFRTPLVCNL